VSHDPGPREALAAEIDGILSGAVYELSASGLYCRREVARTERLIACEEALLRDGSLRVFDFQMRRPADLAENIIAREDADPASYRGAERPGGARVFRVDHHHPLRRLSRESTTPLVVAWLRSLWRAGETACLEQVAAARYLADHCDQDIVLAHHLARSATDRGYIEGPVPDRLAAACIRNDYIEPPPADLEPDAGRVYYACLGVEEAIEAGELRFVEALSAWLPQLGPWLRGEAPAATSARFDAWERGMRCKEGATLGRIGGWIDAGRWREAAGGKVIMLEAPEKIDNADLYLYVVREATAGRSRPTVQLLGFPSGGAGGVTWKVRSHGGWDIMPLLGRLNERFADAGFGGRTAAGGSRPGVEIDPAQLLAEVAAAVEGEA
jgi:hypothetical protein